MPTLALCFHQGAQAAEVGSQQGFDGPGHAFNFAFGVAQTQAQVQPRQRAGPIGKGPAKNVKKLIGKTIGAEVAIFAFKQSGANSRVPPHAPPLFIHRQQGWQFPGLHLVLQVFG